MSVNLLNHKVARHFTRQCNCNDTFRACWDSHWWLGDFITNLLLNSTVKQLGKSVRIWRSYGQEYIDTISNQNGRQSGFFVPTSVFLVGLYITFAVMHFLVTGDWLGRVSPKWPILCRVGSVTLNLNVIDQLLLIYLEKLLCITSTIYSPISFIIGWLPTYTCCIPNLSTASNVVSNNDTVNWTSWLADGCLYIRICFWCEWSRYFRRVATSRTPRSRTMIGRNSSSNLTSSTSCLLYTSDAADE